MRLHIIIMKPITSGVQRMQAIAAVRYHCYEQSKTYTPYITIYDIIAISETLLS